MVLRTDADQLDTAIKQRGKIFKERTQPTVARKGHSSVAAKTGVKQQNEFYSNYGVKQVEVDAEGMNVLPERNRSIPVHEQAQR